MGNVQRHRYEEDAPRMFAVDSAIVIEIGDMLYQDTDDVKPASSKAWDTNEDTTRAAFCALFAGIAEQASASGETADIRVMTKGVAELTCTATTFEVGDLVGPEKDAGGNLLYDQVVQKVTAKAQAIGMVVKRHASNTTTVLVELLSRVGPYQYPLLS